MKHAILSGVVAGFTAAVVLGVAWLALFFLITPPGHGTKGVVIEGGPNGPTTTFTVSQDPTP